MRNTDEQPASGRAFRVAGYRVEPSTLRVHGEGRTVRLEPKAMKVLVYLAENAGRVISRRELEERLWPGRLLSEDALTNSITKLRRELADDARNPWLIETLPKTGYRLVAPVSFEPEQAVVGGWSEEAGGPPRRSGSLVRRPLLLAGILALALGLGVVVATGWLERTPWGKGGNAPVHREERQPVVLVVPFRNLGVPAGQNYFSGGITADLITDLSKVANLLVIAPQSAFALGNASAGDLEIAEGIDVDFVVRGSVQRSGPRLRINVRLVNPADGSTIWAERLDGEIADVFRIQDEVTAGIVTALKVRVEPDERALLAARSTTSIAAYEEFLQGLELHGHRIPEDNEAARRHFERAVRLDPGFARAYAGLALVYTWRVVAGWTTEPERELRRASRFADEAAAIDSDLPQIHFARGEVELFRGNHQGAIEAVDRALDLSPNYADAHALRAWVLHYAGRSAAALAALEGAIVRNPHISASYWVIRGEVYYVQGRYAEAVDALEAALQSNPGHLRARLWLAAAYARLGEDTDARWQIAEVQVVAPDFSLSDVTGAFPFKDPQMLDQLIFGLGKAGLNGHRPQ